MENQLFWSIFSANKDTITKSFRYIYKNCPDKEGMFNAFNNVIVELHRLNIFEKFNPSKTPGDTNKKFQQFLFMWIYKILHDAYNKRKKYEERFNRFHLQVQDKSLSDLSPSEQECITSDPNVDNSILAYSPEEEIEYLELKKNLLESFKKPIERKIIHMLELGYSKKEIASHFGVSQQYISNTIKRMREKINSKKKFILS